MMWRVEVQSFATSHTTKNITTRSTPTKSDLQITIWFSNHFYIDKILAFHFISAQFLTVMYSFATSHTTKNMATRSTPTKSDLQITIWFANHFYIDKILVFHFISAQFSTVMYLPLLSFLSLMIRGQKMVTISIVDHWSFNNYCSSIVRCSVDVMDVRDRPCFLWCSSCESDTTHCTNSCAILGYLWEITEKIGQICD